MKKELLESEFSLENLSLNQILIDTMEYPENTANLVFIGRNSTLRTNQYQIRVYYKFNTTIILNYG